MEAPKSKPLLIVDNYPGIRTLFDEMERKTDPLTKELQDCVQKIRELKDKAAVIQRAHWAQVEDILLTEGFIDQKNVSLSLRDGVIYLDPVRTDFRDILGKLFGDGIIDI